MFGIGNKFGGARRAAPVEQSQAESTASLQGAQMALGHANKAYQGKVDELVDARAKLAALDRIIGGKGADDVDASMDIRERQTIQALVQQLELAVSALLQRQQDAEVALKDAERQASIEVKVAAIKHLKHVIGPEMDQYCVDLEQFVTERLCPALDRARLAVGPSESNFLTAATLGFEMCLAKASRGLIKTGNVYSVLLRDKKWSDYIPSPEDVVKTRSRP